MKLSEHDEGSLNRLVDGDDLTYGPSLLADVVLKLVDELNNAQERIEKLENRLASTDRVVRSLSDLHP